MVNWGRGITYSKENKYGGRNRTCPSPDSWCDGLSLRALLTVHFLHQVPLPHLPSLSSSLSYFLPSHTSMFLSSLLFSSLFLSQLSPQIATRVKRATLPYHIQFSFLQNIHQHLDLGILVEEKVIVHPENIFGGDLRYGQVPTSKPTL